VVAHSDLLRRRRRALEVDLPQIDWKWLQQQWVKTLRVLASIYKSNRASNGQMDKSALG
jgi:hypothetical protein